MAELTKLETGIFLLLVGLLVREAWRGYQAGRIEKQPVYVTHQTCHDNRAARDMSCHGLKALGEYKERTDAKIADMDKRLDKGAEDFAKIRDDIGEIKIVLAGMKVLLENKIETIVIKPKGGGNGGF